MAIDIKVTQNVVMDLDITNGARGAIVDIWLHPDKPATELRTTKTYRGVLIKLDQTRTSRLRNA